MEEQNLKSHFIQETRELIKAKLSSEGQRIYFVKEIALEKKQKTSILRIASEGIQQIDYDSLVRVVTFLCNEVGCISNNPVA
jgi:hypothetical protein